MMPRDDEPAHAGEATGLSARAAVDQGDLEPLGRSGLHHWRQANILNPSLDQRGDVMFDRDPVPVPISMRGITHAGF